MTPVFRLAVDVGAHGLGPRLGLEMYRPRKPSNLDYWLTSGRNAWRPVVDYLEEMKWCLPEKGDGLRAFPGIERISMKTACPSSIRESTTSSCPSRATPSRPKPTPPSPTSGSTPLRKASPGPLDPGAMAGQTSRFPSSRKISSKSTDHPDTDFIAPPRERRVRPGRVRGSARAWNPRRTRPREKVGCSPLTLP